jgi:6,7-dimethyl-8-ribityllumazine synthase
MASALHNLSDIIGDVPSGERKRFAIIVSEWNSDITSKLTTGAIETLEQYEVSPKDIAIETVPGCFELPLAAQTIAWNYNPNAIICLGCVIRGETPHFDYICQAVTEGLMRVGLDAKIPVIFGVLTANTQEQAIERAGGQHGNKGVEAAIAALKMMKFKNDR